MEKRDVNIRRSTCSSTAKRQLASVHTIPEKWASNSERCFLGQISVVKVGECVHTDVNRKESCKMYLCPAGRDRFIGVLCIDVGFTVSNS